MHAQLAAAVATNKIKTKTKTKIKNQNRYTQTARLWPAITRSRIIGIANLAIISSGTFQNKRLILRRPIADEESGHIIEALCVHVYHRALRSGQCAR